MRPALTLCHRCGGGPAMHTRAPQCGTFALLPSAPMPFLPSSNQPGLLRGCLCVGGGAVVREIWPYKPVAHSFARR